MAEEDTIQNLATKQTQNDNTKLETDNVDEAPKESNNVEATKSSNVEKVDAGNMDINNENGKFSLSTSLNLFFINFLQEENRLNTSNSRV